LAPQERSGDVRWEPQPVRPLRCGIKFNGRSARSPGGNSAATRRGTEQRCAALLQDKKKKLRSEPPPVSHEWQQTRWHSSRNSAA